MKRVLLVIEPGEFSRQIQQDLEKDHEVLLCHNTDTAGVLMASHPDALVLQLQLEGTDGLTFLEQQFWYPPVMLTIAVDYSPYVSQKLHDIGVGYLVRTPCSRTAVTDRLRDMLKDRSHTHADPQTVAASHLRVLGIPSDHGGGKHLRVGIPLYAQDPEQKLTQELYPAIAKYCGTTGGSVEHAIRNTIHAAWDRRDPEDWIEYFPRRRRCPSNKVFISTLAAKL